MGWGCDLNLNRYRADRAGQTRVPKEEAAEGADMGDVWERLWEFLLSLPDDLPWVRPGASPAEPDPEDVIMKDN